MGLNPDFYGPLRTQILSQEPLPSLDRAYQLVTQEERVRTSRLVVDHKPPDVLGFAVRTEAVVPLSDHFVLNVISLVTKPLVVGLILLVVIARNVGMIPVIAMKLLAIRTDGLLGRNLPVGVEGKCLLMPLVVVLQTCPSFHPSLPLDRRLLQNNGRQFLRLLVTLMFPIIVLMVNLI